MKSTESLVNGFFKNAIALLEQMAAGGDCDAMLALGVCYGKGNVQAQQTLGTIYLNGENGIPKNRSWAMQYLKKAKKQMPVRVRICPKRKLSSAWQSKKLPKCTMRIL